MEVGPRTKEEIDKALERIKGGEDFSKVAAELSTCPSGRKAGGSLGNFTPGKMVTDYCSTLIFGGNCGEPF